MDNHYENAVVEVRVCEWNRPHSTETPTHRFLISGILNGAILEFHLFGTCVALQIVGISKSWALHIIVCRSGNLYAIICNAHDFGAHDLQHGDFQDRGHFLCSYCTTITFMLA